MQVLFEAYVLFGFELRGLKFNGAEVLFYIKPADGLKLPEIMHLNNIIILAYPKKPVKHYRHFFTVFLTFFSRLLNIC
jgi:hypothetical protein